MLLSQRPLPEDDGLDSNAWASKVCQLKDARLEEGELDLAAIEAVVHAIEQGFTFRVCWKCDHATPSHRPCERCRSPIKRPKRKTALKKQPNRIHPKRRRPRAAA